MTPDQAERWRNRECIQCGVSVRSKNAQARFCSTACRVAGHRRDVSVRVTKPMADLIRTGDRAAVFRRIRSRSRLVDSGCWEWKGRVDEGYPLIDVNGKRMRVHRLVLEMKHGAPLGSQSAHHMCANSVCVNPDHLQPVTQRDNVAEMLARHSYEARIRELEAAVRSLDPAHEVLARVPYGNV